jgi:prepilin signal peptidase PulO-like enzyme (type II secretory pathway)
MSSSPTLPEPVADPPARGSLPRALLWRIGWATPLVLVWPWWLAVHPADAGPFYGSLLGMLFVLLAGTATVTDLLWRRIYNWTTLPAFVWAWVLQLLALVLPGEWRGVLGVDTLAVQAVGTLVGFGIMYLLSAALGGSGMGDLKLVSCFGAMLGPQRVLEALVYAYILAGIGVTCYLLWVLGPRELALNLGQLLGLVSRERELDPKWKSRLPMGPFLSAGAVLALSGWL